MGAGWARCRATRERGANTIEYCAAVILIGGIVVAAISTDAPTQLSGRFVQTVCQVAQAVGVAADCGAEDPEGEENPPPPQPTTKGINCEGQLWGTTHACTFPDGNAVTAQRSRVPVPDEGFAGEVWEGHCSEAMNGETEMTFVVYFEWERLPDGRLLVTGMTVSNQTNTDIFIDDITFLNGNEEVAFQPSPLTNLDPVERGAIEPYGTQVIDETNPGAAHIFPFEVDSESDLLWTIDAFPVGAESYPGERRGPCGIGHQGRFTP